MAKKINFNENKNEVKVSKEKMKELGILKVLGIMIGEGETLYNCVMEDGKIQAIPAASLIEE